MSPFLSTPTTEQDDHSLGLYVAGVGVEYPPYQIRPNDLATLARRFYPSTPALEKVLRVNACTGIDSRSTVFEIDHPIVNGDQPPSIAELSEMFMDWGVKLSVAACRKALNDWGGKLSSITHIVATTCTNSANPGFDSHVVRQLGLKQNIERVLLHGVGCSGGLAALRTAANIALGSSFRNKPARILVLACEISSTLVRSELDSIDRDQEVRIGMTLFSDCASAVVLANDIDERHYERKRLELLGWEHSVIQGTENDLGFDVDPTGWKVILTPNVPSLASAAVPTSFHNLTTNISSPNLSHLQPTDCDWALHPGGATVITNVEKAMGLTPQHLRAAYEVYTRHGNSSSATVFSVLQRLLDEDQDRKDENGEAEAEAEAGESKEHIVGCAFGPGISVEMVMLRRVRVV